MMNRDIIPLEGAAVSSRVKKYSSGERGFAGGGGRKNRESREEKPRGEQFETLLMTVMDKKRSTEFESLLTNVMEGNRRMRETVRALTGERTGPGLMETASAFSFYRGGLVIRQN